MTREPAQAGNRASRTEHYLQWWENSPEWNTETSAVDKLHDSSLFMHFCDAGARWKACLSCGFLNALLPSICALEMFPSNRVPEDEIPCKLRSLRCRRKRRQPAIAWTCADALDRALLRCCSHGYNRMRLVLRSCTSLWVGRASKIARARCRHTLDACTCNARTRRNNAVARTHAQPKARPSHRSSVDILRGRELNPGLPRDRRKY